MNKLKTEQGNDKIATLQISQDNMYLTVTDRCPVCQGHNGEFTKQETAVLLYRIFKKYV